MRRRAVFLLLLAATALAACAFMLRAAPAGESAATARVDIYIGNSLVKRLTLPEGEGSCFWIEQENGARNEICISDGSVYMRSANCSGQDCVAQGAVNQSNYESRALGRYILCLPHKLAVEYVPEG